jgi:single-stranded DNA-specific DHH superfamily exonuclease
MQGKKRACRDFGEDLIMEGIKWVVGNEKRFADFIANLNGKDKIALLSHTDLDGVASAKIVYEVIKPDFVMFVNYDELNDKLIDELKKNKVNKIIMCDLYINELRKDFAEKLKKFNNVLIIDHHPFFFDFNNEKIMFFNADGYCAAYLCYSLFSKIEDLENYDWLVACACISDYSYKKNEEWMKEVFEKYGDEFKGGIAEGIKDGKIIELTWKIVRALIYFGSDIRNVFDIIDGRIESVEGLEKYSNDVQKEINDALEKFEKEKIEIKDGYLWDFVKSRFYIKSLVANYISLKYFDKTILILEDNGRICNVSGRRQDRGDDMNKLLKKLIEGFENASAGGHIPASGGYFPVEYKEEFIRRAKKL